MHIQFLDTNLGEIGLTSDQKNGQKIAIFRVPIIKNRSIFLENDYVAGFLINKYTTSNK